MSSFLVPLCRFCQSVGFLPFRLVTDAESGQLKSFSRSWRYAITWWCVVLAILNALSHFLFFTISFQNYFNIHLSLWFRIIILAISLVYFFDFITSRYWLVFHYSPLCNAVRFMRKIEMALAEENVQNTQNTLKYRMALGLIGLMIWGLSGFYIITKLTFTAVSQQLGVVVTITLCPLLGFISLSFGCALLTLHLIYYQLGYYIRYLSILIDGLNKANLAQSATQNERDRETNFIRMKEKVQVYVRIFDDVCRAEAEWNRIFAFPVLVLVTTKLITIALSLFIIIQVLFFSKEFLAGLDWLFYLIFSTDFSILLVIFTAVDRPPNETSRLRAKMIKLVDNLPIVPTDNNYNILQGIFITDCVQENRLRFSAGLLNIGVYLIPSVTASIITYLVILLQTQEI